MSLILHITVLSLIAVKIHYNTRTNHSEARESF